MHERTVSERAPAEDSCNAAANPAVRDPAPPSTSRWPADPAAWLAGLNRTAKVGAKHHIIPRFLLKRWADDNGRVQVFSRADNRFTLRPVSDLAVRDFYTFIAVDETSDSTYEELLAKVEEHAAGAIGWMLNVLRRHDVALSVDERCSLDLFVAYQLVRGPRSRREIEQLADYYGKTLAEGQVPDPELAELEIRVHQNEHLQTMGPLAESVLPQLHFRPVYLVRLDRPLVWMSDEPVIIDGDDDDNEGHTHDCFLTRKQLRRRARTNKSSDEFSFVRHIRPYRRRGILDADVVLIPLAPHAVLVYGPPENDVDLAIHDMTILGAEATEFADELNAEIAAGALDVIVGSPADSSFRDQVMPVPAPILQVCGPNTVAAATLNEPLRRVRPTRFLNHARWTNR